MQPADEVAYAGAVRGIGARDECTPSSRRLAGRNAASKTTARAHSAGQPQPVHAGDGNCGQWHG